MINASDLRIGNKVLLNGKVVTVSLISKDEPDYIQIEEEGFNVLCKFIEGILLSGELLLKAGFERKGNDDKIHHWYLNYDAEFHNHFGLWFKDDKCMFATLKGHITIDYVHELQNIYFVHYKTELIIEHPTKN